MAASEELDWRDYIHADPTILVGKPVIKGTRLSVEFLLRLFASGWTNEEILDSYPTLSADSLRALFAYAADTAAEERWPPLARVSPYASKTICSSFLESAHNMV